MGIVWHDRIVRIYKNDAQMLMKTSKSLDVYSLHSGISLGSMLRVAFLG